MTKEERWAITSKNRAAAKVSGAKTYASLKPCPRGHTGDRYVSTGGCVACLAAISKSDQKKAYDKKYAEANAQHISKRSKEYRATFPKEHWVEKSREWAQTNPEKRRAISKSYKARRRAAEDGGMSTSDLIRWEAAQPKTCHWCGAKCDHSYHVDHYFPLAKGGPHCEDNLVIACAPCNTRKGAKSPQDWIDQVFREAEKREIDAYLPMYDEWHTEYATA